MPITAYSKFYKRELDVHQLESLFQEESQTEHSSFQDFVLFDVECPSCNVSGGYAVKEGYSKITGKRVSQAHFAFKNTSGGDAHLAFCEFNSTNEKQNSIANEGKVDYRESKSLITQHVGLIVSIGIENNIFTQSDMRNMRGWIINIRKQGQENLDMSPHIINLAQSLARRSKRNFDKYVFDISAAKEDMFNIDKEVYESLCHSFPNFDLSKHFRDNGFYSDIKKRDVAKKAANILKAAKGEYYFDRNILNEKFTLARKLTGKIVKHDDYLSRKLSPSAFLKSNPLMALSSLLLFTSDWDSEKAWMKVENIYKISSVKDSNLGNFIGLNPFANYSAWVIIKKLSFLNNAYYDNVDFDILFQEEKSRLMKLYELQ